MTIEDNRGPERTQIAIGAVLIAALTLVFLLLFWNRFLAMRTGHGFATLLRILQDGGLPHRDYFLSVTPLQFLKMAGLMQVAGTDLIVPRILALVERCGLAALLFVWMARYFKTSHALLASLFAVILSCGDHADFFSSYNHAAILWAIGCGFTACLAIDARHTLRAGRIAFLAGVLAGLCFATKQTIGLGVTLIVPFIGASILLIRMGPGAAARHALAFAGGWLLPMGALWAWLYRAGALGQHFEHVFFSGVSGKGSPSQVFLRPFLLGLKEPRLQAYLAGAVLILLAYMTLCRIWRTKPAGAAGSRWQLLQFAGLALASILAGAAGGLHISNAPAFASVVFLRAPIYVVLFATLWLNLYYAVRLLRRRLSAEQEQFWMICGVSFAVAYMLSLSWPAFEAMLLPGLALITLLAMRRLDGSAAPRRILLSACFLLIGAETEWKLRAPWDWDGWNEAPVRQATLTSSLKQLEGYRLPPETLRVTERVVAIIDAHSSTTDKIYTFPGLSIFYDLSGRRPGTFSLDSGIDVTPDFIASGDARLLLAHPPAVIVVYNPRGITARARLVSDELIWRNGKRSGQRDILDAIDQLTPTYAFHETVRDEFAGITLDVWAKR